MAQVRNNVLMRGIQGSIGDMVFRMMLDGKTHMSGKPEFSSRKFSKGQKNHRSGGVLTSGSTDSADLCQACGGDRQESL